MKRPRHNLDHVPVCQVGMGEYYARLNGYKHGFEGVVTRGVCTLVAGSDEYAAWQEGYSEGERDTALISVYRAFIHFGRGEYGNELMRRVAAEYAAGHGERPLIVTVYEHAGWDLSFLYGAPGIDDGAICGTANDAASLAPAVVAFGKMVGDVEIIDDVFRPGVKQP